MTDSDDWKQLVRRNKLVGMWAAAKLGKTGQDAPSFPSLLRLHHTLEK
jgi:hypothetical protein